MPRISGAIIVIGWMLLAVVSVQAQEVTVPEAARALAENVLGEGQVKMIRATDGVATILIRWESATYKAEHSQAVSRELLYYEALLTSNAIIGQLPQVVRIRFTLLQGERMLATGEASRTKGVSVMFSPSMGGGLYVPPPQSPNPIIPASRAEQTQ